MVLQVYFLALLAWGCWQVIVSDHGSQFECDAFQRVNRRLHIQHAPYPKGHPWQNLVESQFGIQTRVGECLVALWNHYGSREHPPRSDPGS